MFSLLVSKQRNPLLDSCNYHVCESDCVKRQFNIRNDSKDDKSNFLNSRAK